MSPIFIIGTERSGSNLLRLILNAHSRIAIPHPPHIMRYLAHVQPRYGDLGDDDNMRRLIGDILTLIDAHIFPWEHTLDVESLLQAVPQRSTFGAVAAIYAQVMRAEGKARWGNKSTFMVHFTDEVRAVYPRARFLLLVRDPRDVAVSARRSVFSPCHPVLAAELWAAQQALGLSLVERLPPGTIHTLRYEDLLDGPEAAIAAVCAFLEEDFEPGMLRFFEGREARKSARLSESWGNTGKPVLTGNTGKYRTRLSPPDILAVEAICAAPMVALGYAPTHSDAALAAFSLTAADRVKIQLTEVAMWAGVELRSMRRDRNHFRRWRRDITARLLAVRRGAW